MTSAVSGSNRSVLVVANDMLPYPGQPVSGSGLRAWGLGEGLRGRGHDVRYAMPAASANAETPRGADGPLLYELPNLRDVLATAAPDIIVFQHWVGVGAAADLDVPVALDLHGPLMIETAFQRRPDIDPADLAKVKLDAFRRADFVTCAGAQQRFYFLAWLLLSGGDVTEDSISVIPVSLPPEAPRHEWPSQEVNFVYGGMFLPWQDPSVSLLTLVSVLESEDAGRLDFFGSRHPMYPDMETPLLDEVELRLKGSPRVSVRGLWPRDRLLEHYRKSYVALDLMARNTERELAFTTRTAEYLWCGLPVVYNDYGDLTPMIRDYEAGWIASPDDDDGLRALLRKIVHDPAEIRRRSANAQRLARERLSWARTTDPLDSFCRDPVRRRRSESSTLVAGRPDADALSEQLVAVREQLLALRSTRSFRAIEPARQAYGRLRRAVGRWRRA
ncbi:MAG: glycosyltransferase family 4 protein [Acidimicrobiia bacterium]